MDTSPGEVSRVVSGEVRVWMARRGLTQTTLAAAMGISRQAVSLRLVGKTPWTVDDLAIVAAQLDVPIVALLQSSSDA